MQFELFDTDTEELLALCEEFEYYSNQESEFDNV